MQVVLKQESLNTQLPKTESHHRFFWSFAVFYPTIFGHFTNSRSCCKRDSGRARTGASVGKRGEITAGGRPAQLEGDRLICKHLQLWIWYGWLQVFSISMLSFMFESRFYLYLLRFANLVLPCWWGFGAASKILATLPRAPVAPFSKHRATVGHCPVSVVRSFE